MSSVLPPLSASGVTRLVNESMTSKTSLQHVMMAIAMAQIDLQQVKAGEITKAAAANVNRLDASNQLTAQLNKLKALRVEKKIDKDKTMEGQAADCKQFVDNLKAAGISISADEYVKWAAGKMTDADLETINSRIKTMSDNASNQSTVINLELQRSNNQMQQSTNMFTNFMDAIKQMFQNIFR